MKSKIKTYSLIALFLFMALILLVKSCENEQLKKHVEALRVPDTVYVPKPYKVVEIKPQYIEKPVKVYVYLKDTALRKEAEQSDIITGIDIKRKGLFQKMDFIKVDKINPQGMILSSEYRLAPLREIRIDEHGNVEIKKKKFTKLKRAAGILLPLAAGFIVGKEISGLQHQ